MAFEPPKKASKVYQTAVGFSKNRNDEIRSVSGSLMFMQSTIEYNIACFNYKTLVLLECLAVSLKRKQQRKRVTKRNKEENKNK